MSEDSPFRQLEPTQRRQHTLQALQRVLLRDSQEQPLLLVCEDLHWIDAETQALLDRLVESLPTARLLLLVNYRPEYQHGWGSKPSYTHLRLDPLPPASAEAFLHALLGEESSLVPLTPLLIARTEGNPFFLEESVRTLVETGVLVGEPGAYRLVQALPTIQVPATVQAVLAARIDRLPLEEKRLLQTAAVVGTEVPLPLLQTIADVPEAALHRRLAHLQAAEFLYETRLFPAPEYTFKHALTHDVAYGSLLLERRRVLHARVVEALEALDRNSGTPSTDMRILARTWLALPLSALGAFTEGRRHGQEALRLATLAGRGITPSVAHGCLGLLYLAQGDLEHAIEVLEQGLALCHASGNRDFLRMIVASLGYVSALQGRLAEGRTLLEEAISESLRTGARQRPLWVAWLSEVCRLAGRYEEAWQHARQALDLARQLKERGNEAHALHQLGAVQAHASPPDVVQAEAHYQQALARAEELGMRPLVAHCHHGLGRLYATCGQQEQARAALIATIDLYRAMDMTFWLPQAEAALAQVVG